MDNRLVVASGLNTLLLVTSADVLHCFTVPSLGVKVDAVPGRLNYLGFVDLWVSVVRAMVEAVAPIDLVDRLVD